MTEFMSKIMDIVGTTHFPEFAFFTILALVLLTVFTRGMLSKFFGSILIVVSLVSAVAIFALHFQLWMFGGYALLMAVFALWQQSQSSRVTKTGRLHHAASRARRGH